MLDPSSFALTYLIAADASEAVIIDPLRSQTTLIQVLLAEHRLRLKYVLRTHVHRPDRIDCGGLCSVTGAEFVVGAKNAADIPGKRVAEGATLVFGNEHIDVLETPGHTPGCVSYVWRDRLFCGDVLELGGCGQAEDETNPGAMYDSVQTRIFALNNETLIFPGHDYTGRTVSTVGEERARNAAFSGVSRDTFIAQMATQQKRPPLSSADAEPASRLISLGRGQW